MTAVGQEGTFGQRGDGERCREEVALDRWGRGLGQIIPWSR